MAMNKTDQMSFFGFEAEPVAVKAKPVKAKIAKSVTPMETLPGLILAEVAPQAMPITSPDRGLSAEAPLVPQTSNPAVTPVIAADAEAMAQTLAQHPDFRVLRRLVPRTDYGPVSGQNTRRVIVLDTETTGLDARNEKVIELAMLSVLVDTATGQPLGPVTVYESFEDPGKPIPPQITEITGIDDSMVQGQRIDDAAVTALVEQADLIVAHNAGFDRPFVEARLCTQGLELLVCGHRLEERRQRLGQAGVFGLRARLVLRRPPCPGGLPRLAAGLVLALVGWADRLVALAERGRADSLQTAGYRCAV
jgi:DNA polymerase III subunit epsilon